MTDTSNLQSIDAMHPTSKSHAPRASRPSLAIRAAVATAVPLLLLILPLTLATVSCESTTVATGGRDGHPRPTAMERAEHEAEMNRYVEDRMFWQELPSQQWRPQMTR